MDLSNKKCLVYDHGMYTYLAQHLGKYFEKVYYHIPIAEPYPHSPIAHIGQGLPNIQWVDSLWDYIDKVDCLFFPDVYDGKFQVFLREKGYKVCGSGLGEKMELDKGFFHEMMDKYGLPVVKTYRAEGLDDLWEYVKDKKNLFMKSAEKHRGDWETCKHHNRYQTALVLNRKRQELGEDRAKEIEILVQNSIDAECEAGCDGFMLNGEMPDYSIIGYEIKDEGYLGKVMPVFPKIVQDSLNGLAPVYEKLGYQGPYSNEMRITRSGKVYRIDETCRCGSPPSAVLPEMYGKAYAKAVWYLAHGEMPDMSGFEHEYGAEVILSSRWHEKNELHVGMPKEIEGHVKLKNSVKKQGQFFCIPNDNDGIFGSVAVAGDSVAEVTERAMDIVKQLEVSQLDYKENLFDECSEVVKCGEKYGIKF